ncbi:phospholipid-binding protein, PBP family [Cupriavidus sp. YR651]|nr:phospholipid-binding protein, PBP family [Cupriavidus sp. YR651]
MVRLALLPRLPAIAAMLFGPALLAQQIPSMPLILTSPAFSQGGEIPTVHTCEGTDVSPPLAWSGMPPATASLALIVDDPDAPDPASPQMTWVHWVVYNLPPQVGSLAQGASRHGLPPSAREGLNDWHRANYGGPCPPIGRHRYFHKLYALDVVLPDLGKPDKAALEQAMRGHILAHAELIGTYQKHGR